MLFILGKLNIIDFLKKKRLVINLNFGLNSMLLYQFINSCTFGKFNRSDTSNFEGLVR